MSTVVWGTGVAAILWLILYFGIVPKLKAKALRSEPSAAPRSGAILAGANAARAIAAGVLVAGAIAIAGSVITRSYLHDIDIAEIVTKSVLDARAKIAQLFNRVKAGSAGDGAEAGGQQALEASAPVLGEGDPSISNGLDKAAQDYFAQSDWARAAAILRQSTATLSRRSQSGVYDTGGSLTGNAKSATEQSDWPFYGLIKAASRLAANGGEPAAQASREMFRTAQSALGFKAAERLAQRAARGANGDPELAGLTRARHDLVAEWRSRDVLRNAWLREAPDRRDAIAEAANAAQLASIEAQLAAIDSKLVQSPDDAAFVSSEPLSVEAVQALLGADEALVLFVDTPEWTPAPEETFIWVVTKADARWVSSELGTQALIREVGALRCGLDEEEWATPANAKRCTDLLGLADAPDASRPLPFHLGKAHELYQALFGQIEATIAGKRLLIVPSGALTSLPFHALVTKPHGTVLPDRFEGYRGVAWLGRSHGLTTLPAVSSLKAQRQPAHGSQAAARSYAGYGDPLLNGEGTSCRETKAPAECPEPNVAHQPGAEFASRRATIRSRGPTRMANIAIDKLVTEDAMPQALPRHVRELCPLPDSAYEIKCVAEQFKAQAPLIRLAGKATEADLKALSQSGKLAEYSVLHFATHGLLSGDAKKMPQRDGEPALVLTPPEKPANADDDGLLMASEVAALRLNADWVVLSASNTAAGDEIGAEALSSLARAFFHAGGRALLVSHWPVYSDAAVRLAMGTFAEFERKPAGGRAAALQRVMTELMDDRSQADNAHPAIWAPFVVVGEGGR